ncbi:MAG: AAA family ATPase, partial [Actinomycetota bacterium]|nr:AAA family ATPase [Actinomycetota bacterium]
RELVAITQTFVGEHAYLLGDDAESVLSAVFDGAPRGEGFGNARFARTLFEQALNMHGLRLAREGLAEAPSLEDLQTLTAEDLRAAARALGEEPLEASGVARPFFRRRRRAS